MGIKKRLFATKELRLLREEKGWSKREMADILTALLHRPVSYETYRKIEQGKYGVPVDDAMAICRTLEQPANNLWEAK